MTRGCTLLVSEDLHHCGSAQNLFFRAQARAFDESLNDFLQSLMYNTQTSGNFAAFIRVFLRRSTELKTSEQYEKLVWFKNSDFNSFYFIRSRRSHILSGNHIS